MHKNSIISRKVGIAVTGICAILGLCVFAYVHVYHQDPLAKFQSQQEIFTNLGGDAQVNTVSGTLQLSDIWPHKVVALYFGFTRCPDICPTSLAIMHNALNKLTLAERNAVQIIYISADPEYDTVQTMQDYVSFFIADGIGAVTSAEQTQKIAKNYGAYIQKIPLQDSVLGYTVDHSTRWYILTKQGKVGTMLEHNVSPTHIAETLAIFTKQYL